MISSAHIDNKKKYILLLGKGPRQRLEHTLTGQKIFSNILQRQKRNFALACIITEQIVICLLMVQIFINSRQKILKL